MSRIYLMLNARSGTADLFSDDLAERLATHGHTVELDADNTRTFAARLAQARASNAEILMAAGGDGTVTALAEVAAETGRPLCILPLGTANLLARDLHLPLDIDAWIAAMPDFVERRIDIARLNGRAFLHKAVIGFVPSIAAAREKLRGVAGIGAHLAFLGYAARRILRTRRIALEITRDGAPPHIDRLQAVAIANNAYDEAFGHIFSRASLESGALSVYKLHTVTLFKAISLAAGVLIGHWRDDAALSIDTAHTVTIRSRRKRLKVMVDGEVETLRTPLRFTIENQALTVLAPPAPVPANDELTEEAAA